MASAEETVIAIIGSIKKWECIALGIGVNLGGDNCPLCVLFMSCTACPVCSKVRHYQCEGTPYTKIAVWHNTTVPDWIKQEKLADETSSLPDGIDTTLDAIEEEIEFLISLLPIHAKEGFDEI